MDPVSIIVSALVGGASTVGTAVAKSTAEKAAHDAYDRLKELVTKKCRNAPIQELESNPKSVDAKTTLQMSLQKEPGVGKDAEVLALARKFLKLIEQDPDGKMATLVRKALKSGEARRYLITRGPIAFRDYTGAPGGQWDASMRGSEDVSDLRIKLLNKPPLRKATQITVTGTLFPCALLSAGWWERLSMRDPDEEKYPWKDHVQEWLFNGFDLWAPSWDFTWDF